MEKLSRREVFLRFAAIASAAGLGGCRLVGLDAPDPRRDFVVFQPETTVSDAERAAFAEAWRQATKGTVWERIPTFMGDARIALTIHGSYPGQG